jgi:hypothetical protein
MGNQNSTRRMAYMFRHARKIGINRRRDKIQPSRLYTRGVFELPDGSGAVRVNGVVYASEELAPFIGDITWVRVSKKTETDPVHEGVAFDEFQRPYCFLKKVPALGVR